MHGGTNPGRPIIHGAYSKRLREARPELATYVEELQAGMEPGILDLTEPVRWLTARLMQAIERDEPDGHLVALMGAIASGTSAAVRAGAMVEARTVEALVSALLTEAREVMSEDQWREWGARLKARGFGPILGIDNPPETRATVTALAPCDTG